MIYKSPSQFLNESLNKLPYSFKVQLLTDSYDPTDPISIGENPYKYLAGKYLFKIIGPNNMEDFNPSLPSFNMFSQKFFNSLTGYDLKNVLNKADDREISIDKSIFYKEFQKESFIPKTVFKKENVSKLNFPIIAKPSKGHSGKGIYKFEKIENIPDKNFDLYQNAIDIKEEFRVICFKGTPFIYMKRIPNKISNNKNLDVNSTTKFTYVFSSIIELEKRDDYESGMNIISTILERVKMDLVVFDFIKDKRGDLFVTEINSQPGGIGFVYPYIFREIYNWFWKKNIVLDTNIMHHFYKLTLSNNRCIISKDVYNEIFIK